METKQIHEPIIKDDYDKPCDGIATLRFDPFAAEVWEKEELVWHCDCSYRNSCMDI